MNLAATCPILQCSILGRAVMALAVAVLTLSQVSDVKAQDKPGRSGAVLALPSRPADIDPFLARMDDQQARATLARVLEERLQPSGSDRTPDLLLAFEDATARLASRIATVSAAAPELAAAPSRFWRWLTSDGVDPTAPLRALAGAVLIIAVCWAAQAGAASVVRAVMIHRIRAGRGAARERAEVAVMIVRWLAFLAAIAATHALVPEGARPSRLVALATALAFAGTWIGSRAISVVLPALHGPEGPKATANLSLRRLTLALAILFTGLFGLVLLREAGIPADARLLVGLIAWTVFGVGFVLALGRMPQPVPGSSRSASERRLDPLESLLMRRGPLLLRLSFIMILVVSAVVAVVRGPEAFWRGLASLGLLALLVAALGLTRTASEPAATGDVTPASPWAATLRRALRILALVGFALALAEVWGLDLFHTANAHLGERLARGILTVTVTAILAYLTWELIRTALAQSALGTPRTEFERGEEGGGTAGTRLQTFGPVLRNFLFVVVVTVAAMVCLSSFGVDIGPLLAGASVIGIALGFGAQTLVRDIISGVFFLAEDAFRIGEYIELGNTRGTVEGIAIRSLKLRHHRGAVHTVPFGEIKQLTNYSRDWIIIKLEFLLAFDTDLRKVKRLVKEIGKELETHPELGHALLEPVKSQGIRRMEPTGMVVGVKFMAKPGSEVYMLRREVYHRVRDAFEQNGIHFARPQVVVAAPADGAGNPSSLDQLAAAAVGGVANDPKGPPRPYT